MISHQRQSNFRETCSAWFLAHDDFRPAIDIEKQDDDRFRGVMYLEFFLPLLAFLPGNVFLRKNCITECAGVCWSKIPKWRIDIHSA
jgi:hypothetical protein